MNTLNNEFEIEKLNYDESLYLLRELYLKVYSILKLYFNNGITITNVGLNLYYTLFQQMIDYVLKLNNFSNLRKIAPELYISLIGDIEDMGILWETTKEVEILNFLSLIESEFIKNGMLTSKLPKDILEAFNNVDVILNKYKQDLKKAKKQLFDNSNLENEITIESIRLDEDGCFLDINKGEKIIIFKSNKGNRNTKIKTKDFIVLDALFGKKRFVTKDSKLKEEGDTISLDNLRKLSSSPSIEALNQSIKRLRKKFEVNNIPITIKKMGDAYMLIVGESTKKVR